MRTKMMSILVAAAFVCWGTFFMASCAKKQIGVSEKAKPAPAVVEKKAVVVEKGEKPVASTRVEDEAARQERLAVLESAKKLSGEIREFESENIYFDFDKSDLKPPARGILRKKADWLRQHPDYTVRIAGNCDERGTSEYNLALGERRANSAKKFLANLGISGDRISTISYGEERPADPRHTPEAWAKNRRDTFELFK